MAPRARGNADSITDKQQPDSTIHADETPDQSGSDTNADDDDSHIDGRTRRAQNNQLRKAIIGKKRDKLDESKENDSLRRFRYLLGLTDLFRHFIETNPNPKIRNIVAEIDRQNAEAATKTKKKSSSRQGGAANDRRRRTEAEEDAELLQDEKTGGRQADTIFRESPPFIDGLMRDYQIAGLNWMISLHENGISGILADEMGLGKTLQTISFLGYLRHVVGITGPHLVTVPKSTLDNWKREFTRWTPDVNVLVLQGAKDERAQLIKDRLVDEKFDVCITSYEMVLREKSHLNKFAWQYIIIDEAHRIKNEESSLSQVIRLFESRNRLLITGTPLQNNLHELWALLNFLLPDVFGDANAFDQWFSGQDRDQDTVIQQLHRVLRPFLLRRVKSDVEKSLLPKREVNVYVGMTEMQVRWYQKILEKDIDAVNGAGGKRESKTRLLNIVMQLRKCCNHPYLFEGAEPTPFTTDEHLITNAGKMIVIDRLLSRLRRQGSRVLIFSQMSRLLDILEDYCVFRQYQYCRIDGGTAHEDRIAAIDDYNRPGSDKFVFLLTTRAGGLGINLTTADIVVLYDSDWNPQADLQAMDRAHRIGQTKQVIVYRFVTDNAIEEKVLERAAQKLRLDQLVIQQGRTQTAAAAAKNNKEELLSMIQHGAEKVFQSKGATGIIGDKGADLGDDDIEAILVAGESRTKELNARYEKLGLDDLQKFTAESAYEWNGEDFAARKKDIGMTWINPAKRERKEQVYSVDKYYKQALQTGGNRVADAKPKAPRAPRQIATHDYQFFPPALRQLHARETAYYRKEIGYKLPLPGRAGTGTGDGDGDGDNDHDATNSADDLAAREAEREAQQREIDEAVPLTEEEQEEKQRLAEQGFASWTRRDFLQFVHSSGKHGRDNYADIAADCDKTPAEIRAYADVFWARCTDLPDYARHLKVIEEGEERRAKVEHQRRCLRKKLGQCRVPLQQLKINYSVSTTNKKVYTEEEDRFLLVMLDKLGLDRDGLHDLIRDEIHASPLFRFDWFFLSRTPTEISRRCTTLLTTIVKEFDETNGAGGAGNKPAPAATANGKHKREVDDEENDEDSILSMAPKKKSKANGVKNKALENVKSTPASKATSAAASRSSSVNSTRSPSAAATPPKKAKGKKK